MIKINIDNFEKEILNSDTPVLIDFNADWCGPCKMLKPVLEEIEKENKKYKFASINIDDEGELADKYNVSSIPCLVILKNGKEITRSIGFRPKDEIEQFLEEN